MEQYTTGEIEVGMGQYCRQDFVTKGVLFFKNYGSGESNLEWIFPELVGEEREIQESHFF